MKTLIAGALALLLTSAAGQASNLTMGQYMNLAKESPLIANEILAAFRGAHAMNAYWELRADLNGAPYVYCVKEDTTFTLDLVIDILAEYVRVDAQSRGMPREKVGLVLVQALQWKYPCY